VENGTGHFLIKLTECENAIARAVHAESQIHNIV